jgi:hypothetical protein
MIRVDRQTRARLLAKGPMPRMLAVLRGANFEGGEADRTAH